MSEKWRREEAVQVRTLTQRRFGVYFQLHGNLKWKSRLILVRRYSVAVSVTFLLFLGQTRGKGRRVTGLGWGVLQRVETQSCQLCASGGIL